jgi:glycosyltransferase involved in cell wall biosynthesis
VTRPAVSVVIPCFNQGQFVEAAIESVAHSTAEQHEVIVVDDGSTDRGTRRVLSWLQPCAPHQRLVIERQENQGLAASRNAGLAEAKGEWIQFLDADDLLMTGAIDARISQARDYHRGRFSDSTVDCVLGQYAVLDHARGAVVAPAAGDMDYRNLAFDDVALRWERGLSIPIHCALFRRQALDWVGPFEASLSSKEDWFFWLNFLVGSPRVVSLAQVVAVYRIHDANMTRTRLIDNAASWLQVTQLAQSLWPERFGADVVAASRDHWRSQYLPQLWQNCGPNLPWAFYRRLFDEPMPGTREDLVRHVRS